MASVHTRFEQQDSEEEVSSTESESESEHDKTSVPASSSLKPQPPPSSSSDSQSESDSDKAPERSQLPDPTVKPQLSKPMDAKISSRNPNPRPPTGKRPAAAVEDEAPELKSIKKKKTVVAAEKKPLFERLWSEDDEVELIKGMIDYVEEKGKDPIANVKDFYKFVKKSLHIEVNQAQVLTKARKLRNKFRNNAAKAENKMKVRSFFNPHEKKMYQLSKNIWGKDSNKNAGNEEVGNVNEVERKEVHGLDHLRSMAMPITDEAIMNKGQELVSGPKKVEMEEKWKKLKMQELEHFVKKVDLLKEVAEVVLNAVAKSGAK